MWVPQMVPYGVEVPYMSTNIDYGKEDKRFDV